MPQTAQKNLVSCIRRKKINKHISAHCCNIRQKVDLVNIYIVSRQLHWSRSPANGLTDSLFLICTVIISHTNPAFWTLFKVLLWSFTQDSKSRSTLCLPSGFVLAAQWMVWQNNEHLLASTQLPISHHSNVRRLEILTVNLLRLNPNRNIARLWFSECKTTKKN